MEAKQTFHVEILSTGTIKPSSPTLHDLKTFHLSVWDQPIPSVHIATVFFFPAEVGKKESDDDITFRFHQRSTWIQTLLSHTLTHYFPLAGRIKDESTIDCNDEGAYFAEARVRCPLIDFIGQPHLNHLDLIIPTKDPHFPSSIVFAVQLTLFNCGAVAISACLSHKIIDGASSSVFFHSWTAMARGEVVAPKFLEPSPPAHQDLLVKMPRVVRVPSGNFTTRRFVFSAKAIAALKAKILKATGLPVYLTDVDVVTALIMTCAIAAHRSLSSSEADPIILFHHVNMRRKLVPQLPQNTIGNIYCAVPVLLEANEVDLDHLACKIRKGLAQFYADAASNEFKDYRELHNSLINRNYYRSTSSCGGSLYKQDFGLGKPVWATYTVNSKNLIVLGDTREGGIEAWMSLDDEEMVKFEVDEELLAFGTLNPNPCAL